MPIQIMIFLTKTKIFAYEINSSGKMQGISINGNTEISCERKENVDEMILCLFDAFNIDDFADDHFDIIVIESGADRDIIRHLEMKCTGAIKFNIISMDKILPVIASNKNLLKIDKEVTVTFENWFYKIYCIDSNIVNVEKIANSESAIVLQENDFAFLYRFVANPEAVTDKSNLVKANAEIRALHHQLDSYTRELAELREIQKQFVALREEQKKREEELEKKKREEKNKHINENSKFCPNCGNMLKAGSNFCETCGSQIFENKNASLMQVIKQHKHIFDSSSEYQGEFYIGEALPHNRIRNLLQKSSNINKYVDYNKIFALYCPPKNNSNVLTMQGFSVAALATQRNSNSCKMSNLLFTEDGFFYDADSNGNYGFIYWYNIKNIGKQNSTSDSYNDSKNIIFIQLNDGKCLYFYGVPLFNIDANGNHMINHTNLSNPFAAQILAGMGMEEEGINERTQDFLANFIATCHNILICK